jgi:preprotein translocase subunit SecG
MTTLVTILMILSAFILIVAVLLQPAKGTTGGVLGGSSQSLFGSTGGTTFLFRLTMWCAGIIMVGALFLTWSRIREGRQSVLDSIPAANVVPPPAAPTTDPAAAPATGDKSP